MPVRSADASWQGTLRDGSGTMKLQSGAYEGAYSFATRFQDQEGSNPEELIAAAHAGCFAMALSGNLTDAGYEPTQVDVTASVHLEDGAISKIELDVDADVPDIDEATFLDHAAEAKDGCPVSQALASVPEITVSATLR